MSSSTVNAVGGGLHYYHARRAGAAGATGPTAGTDPTGATGSATGARPQGGGPEARLEAALQDQGITGTKLSDLSDKIHQAVQSAKSDGTDVKSAVDSVLKDAGVDTDALQAEMRPPQGAGGPHGMHGHHHRPGGPGGPPPGSPPTDDPDGDGSTTTSSSTATTGPSALQSILGGTGVDANAFKTQLQSILDGSSTDVSSLFANANLGSSIDVMG